MQPKETNKLKEWKVKRRVIITELQVEKSKKRERSPAQVKSAVSGAFGKAHAVGPVALADTGRVVIVLAAVVVVIVVAVEGEGGNRHGFLVAVLAAFLSSIVRQQGIESVATPLLLLLLHPLLLPLGRA